MIVRELLARLEEKNLVLSIKGDELVIRGKRELLDGPLLKMLREHKQDLLESLRAAKQNPGKEAIPVDCEAITPEMLSLVSLSEDQIRRVEGTVLGGARNIQDIYPLAPLQEGMLFHHLMVTQGDVFLVSEVLRFVTRERLQSFVDALQAVVDRHDILRTAVLWEGLAEPVQVVWRRALLKVEEVTLEAGKDEVAQLRARFDPRHYRIDVRQAPMMRLFIARELTGSRWLMLMSSHHLVSDRTTWELKQREVQAHLLGKASELPPPVPFRAFVAQTRRKGSQEEHEAFFRGMLADVDEPTAPFGLTNVHDDGAGTADGLVEIDMSLARMVRAQARIKRVSVATLFHLAWALVLARISGRDDVVFGTVLLGRLQGGVGVERVLGLFINTLPIRIRVGYQSVEHSLQEVHALLAQLLRHENAPLVLAQRCSAVLAPAPLFTTLLNYRHASEVPRVRSGAQHAWEGIEYLSDEGRTNYPITFSIDDLGEGFALRTLVQAPLDPNRICAFMHRALEQLVVALEQSPQTSVRSLDVLPEPERRQLLVQWNATKRDYPHDRCVHELFEQQVERTPAAVAVVYGNEHLTYRQLDERANQLAHHLLQLGIIPDNVVGLCVERSVEMAVGLLGILKAGGAYLPLDPQYPTERLRFMLEDAQVPVLLTQERLGCRLPVESSKLIYLDQSAPLLQDYSKAAPALQLSPQHLGYVIYTSGSTGRPKGVSLPHAALTNLMLWHLETLRPTLRALQLASLSFDASFHELFAAWLCGGAVVVPPEELRRDVQGLGELIQAQQIDKAIFPVVVLQQLAERFGQSAGVLKSLREVMVTGEQLQVTDGVRALFEQLGECGFHNHYGPSETHVVTALTLGTSPREWVTYSSIGQPIPNTQIYVLNEQFEPAPIGVIGELYIGGVSLARGYLNRPSLTAERFVADPFGEAGGRLYRTGDRARYLPNGNLDFLGRADHQVKVRGYRIEPGEIEAALLTCPGVKQASVAVHGDAPGDRRLVGYIVCAEGASAAPPVSALREHLLLTLPEHMVPAVYVTLDAFPLTPNGKLDRRALPSPDGTAYAMRSYDAPIGEVENVLAGIWAELLRVERVGRRDHFFELGGHSLLAVRVLSRLREMLGVDVRIAVIFARPVLADLAVAVTQAARSALPAITVANREAPLPLSFAQQRLWFLSQIETGSQAYIVPLGLRLTGVLDRAALRRALDRIVARHEVLRTCIHSVNGEPVQRIDAALSFPLQEHDLSRYADTDARLRWLRIQELTEPFDLATGPLLRGRLIQLREHEHALLITFHHIVTDGWSIGLLMRELSTLYQAYRDNQPDPLPPLRIQYADYAVWQRRVLRDFFPSEGDCWRRILSDAPAVLQLPTDRPRPAQQDYRGAVARLQLGERLTSALKELSQRHGTTLFMSLLAGWAIVLSRLSGQQNLVVGTPVANRTHADLEPLMGFFVNTLALHLDLSNNPTVRELLQRVKTQVLEAHQHQDFPFEQVVEIIKPPRNVAHSPIFQVMLVWQNNESAPLTLPDLSLAPLGISSITAKFDLTLNLAETNGRVSGAMEFATALFDQSTIDRHLRYLVQVLHAMTEDEACRVGYIDLITASERQQLLVEWTATQREYPSNRSVHELFEEQVARSPEAIAVVCEEQQLTYGELNRRANRLSSYLRQLGAHPGECIPIVLPRSAEMLVAQLAVLKAHCTYVPLDPQFPAQRQAFIIRDCGARRAITASIVHGAQLESAVCWIEIETAHDAIASCSDRNPPTGTPWRPAAYVMYTSGSTGTPKGVIIEHRAVNRLVINNGFTQIDHSDCVAHCSNPAFDASTFEVWAALLHGARVLVVPQAIVLDSRELARVLLEQRATVLWLTVGLFNEYAQALADAFGRMRYLLVGGDAPDPRVIARVLRESPPRYLINGYGPTESTTFAATHLIESVADGAKSIPIGRPISNTQIYILDDREELAAIGVCGEIHIGGEGVACGYLNQPGLTAERFVADPFSERPGARMYKTGDLGWWRADGIIEFRGRNDAQVKVRGHRIELGEIEACLKAHAGIADAAVIPREDNPGEKRLTAYFIPKHAHVDVQELRTYLLARLPDYMVPGAFIALESLPLTANGKLDRKALPAPQSAAHATRGYEAPQGHVEDIVAHTWAQVLQLERIGRHDQFFELGGHSLLATRVVNRLRRAGFQLTAIDVFNHPTVESMAARLQQQNMGSDSESPIVVRAHGAQRPLFLIHDHYALDLYFAVLAAQIDADIPIYGLPAVPLHEPQLQTVEHMAARLVRMIRDVPGAAPYRIAGWSFGGVLAYEVARQLIAANQRVELVGLLDTYCPLLLRRMQLRDALSHSAASQLLACCETQSSLDSGKRMAIRELRRTANEMQLEDLLNQCRLLGVLPPTLEDRTEAEIRQYIARLMAHAHALENYATPPILTPVHLFVADDMGATAAGPPAVEDSALGWREVLLQQLLEIVRVRGSHYSMMSPPHVAALGRALSKALCRADEQYPSARESLC